MQEFPLWHRAHAVLVTFFILFHFLSGAQRSRSFRDCSFVLNSKPYRVLRIPALNIIVPKLLRQRRITFDYNTIFFIIFEFEFRIILTLRQSKISNEEPKNVLFLVMSDRERGTGIFSKFGYLLLCGTFLTFCPEQTQSVKRPSQVTKYRCRSCSIINISINILHLNPN